MNTITRSEKVAIVSIAVNIILLGLKYALARLSGSMALLADVVHSSTDVIAAFAVFLGLRISRRKSVRFPYGLYKMENLVSVLISIAVLLAGYGILRQAITGGGSTELRAVPVSVIGITSIIGVTFGLSRYMLHEGKQIGSPSIQADGRHIRTDMFSSVVVLASMVGSLFGLHLDRIAAGIMTAFIAYAGTKIFIDAIRVLLDASLSHDLLDNAREIVLAEPAVTKIKSLGGRNSGSYRFMEAEIVMNVRDLGKAHAISQRIEQKLRERITNIDSVLIHYEPFKKDTTTCAIPLADQKETVHAHFGEAPFYGLYTLDNRSGNIVRSEIIDNPHKSEEKGKGILVAEALVQCLRSSV